MFEQIVTPRRNRTKEHFQHALIDLIKEKGFQSVTVKDIVEKRNTIEVHFIHIIKINLN